MVMQVIESHMTCGGEELGRFGLSWATETLAAAYLARGEQDQGAPRRRPISSYADPVGDPRVRVGAIFVQQCFAWRCLPRHHAPVRGGRLAVT